MNKLFKKISFEYVVFPQLFLVHTLKDKRKWPFFMACAIVLPYNLLLLSIILISFFLIFGCFIFIEILKKIFTKR